MNYGVCETSISHKIIVLEEKRTKITFLNDREGIIRKVRIDGCVINEGRRCDYLLICNSKHFFIELKGSDVKHAFEQISSTIEKLSLAGTDDLYAYIVTHSNPLSSTQNQILMKRMHRNMGCKLEILSSNKQVAIVF